MKISIRAASMALALVGVAASLILPAGAGPLDSVPTQRLVNTSTFFRSYPTRLPDGADGPSKAWTVIKGSGNGAENYVAANAAGLLVNVGGGVRVSRNGGLTWSQVITTRAGSENEGAVATAPNGDIVAVEWGAFSADRLQSYKYTAATDSWLTSEVPLHTPFFDRPWIGVIKGPFDTLTGTAPYMTVLRGGWPSKDLWLYSFDGLNYERVGNAGLEADLVQGETSGPLPVVADPDLDYVQAHPQSKVTSLADGGLAFGPGCLVSRTRRDASWGCHQVGDEMKGSRVLVDSRGWIHAFQVSTGYMQYHVSDDGGATWSTTAAAYPDGLRMVEYDVKVSAAAGLAALAVHGQGMGVDQTFAMRWDIANVKPAYLGVDMLGNGDMDFGAGITATLPRFDFMSITFLPGGKIAMSMADAEMRVALAIEQ